MGMKFCGPSGISALAPGESCLSYQCILPSCLHHVNFADYGGALRNGFKPVRLLVLQKGF